MKRILGYMLVVALIAGVGPRPAAACAITPPTTVLTGVIIDPGPPITVTLIFDPWTTFASDPNMFCTAAFRFPTAMIDTIDHVSLVETGTDTLVAGFGSWDPNATTSSDVEAMVAAGAGNAWFGFLNDLGASVSSGVEADFQVDVTLESGVTLSELMAALDGESVVFSDEGNASGNPIGTHPGFVTVQLLSSVPALDYWGTAVLLLTLLGIALIFRRTRRTSGV